MFEKIFEKKPIYLRVLFCGQKFDEVCKVVDIFLKANNPHAKLAVRPHPREELKPYEKLVRKKLKSTGANTNIIVERRGEVMEQMEDYDVMLAVNSTCLTEAFIAKRAFFICAIDKQMEARAKETLLNKNSLPDWPFVLRSEEQAVDFFKTWCGG